MWLVLASYLIVQAACVLESNHLQKQLLRAFVGACPIVVLG